MQFPLLEQMRDQREREEAEITAPIRHELAGCRSHVHSLQDALAALERVVGSEVAKYMVQEIGHGIGDLVRRRVFEAVAKSNPEPGGFVTLTFEAEELRYLDPSSAERMVLNRYLNEHVERISVRAITDMVRDYVPMIDVEIPAIGYRHAILDPLK